MSMPDVILAATHAPLRVVIDHYISPGGEAAEDGMAIVCYTIERALQQCAGDMSRSEYEVLDSLAQFINEQGYGRIDRMDSFEDAREARGGGNG